MLLLADNPQYLCACAMRFSITVDIYVSMRAVFIPKQKCDFATYAWNGGYYYFGDNNTCSIEGQQQQQYVANVLYCAYCIFLLWRCYCAHANNRL